jgi:hypothetical protein
LEKEILIVPVADKTEFGVLKDQRFYRLPAEKGYSNPSRFAYLAVYRSLPHKRVDHVAKIRRVRIVKGKELDFGRYRAEFPNYMRGGHNYERNFQKIEVGKLIPLAKRVVNTSSQPFRNPRSTTFERLPSARSVKDLTLR